MFKRQLKRRKPLFDPNGFFRLNEKDKIRKRQHNVIQRLKSDFSYVGKAPQINEDHISGIEHPPINLPKDEEPSEENEAAFQDDDGDTSDGDEVSKKPIVPGGDADEEVQIDKGQKDGDVKKSSEENVHDEKVNGKESFKDHLVNTIPPVFKPWEANSMTDYVHDAAEYAKKQVMDDMLKATFGWEGVALNEGLKAVGGGTWHNSIQVKGPDTTEQFGGVPGNDDALPDRYYLHQENNPNSPLYDPNFVSPPL